MNLMRDPDEILAAWIDEGPTDLPDATRRAIVNALPMTKRARRGLFAPWSFTAMNGTTRIVATALVAIVAVGAALYLIRPGPGFGGPGPSPTPTTPAPSPTKAIVAIPDPTIYAFTSPLYGYSAIYPNGWINSAATEVWADQTNFEMWDSNLNAPWVDKAYQAATGVTMTGVAMPFAAGTDQEAWIESYLALPTGTTATCEFIAGEMELIVIDGRPARLTNKCDHVAYVIADSRIYVFAISLPSDPAVFPAFLSTVKLPPG